MLYDTNTPLALALLLTGCGAAAQNPAQAPVRAGAPGPLLPEGPRLLELEADADGDGEDDPVALYEDGRLAAGLAWGQADVQDLRAPEEASLRLVVIDDARATRGLLLSFPLPEDEDPPDRHQLFAIEGAQLRRVLDVAPGSYGGTPLFFPGDGSVRYDEDGWAACDRAGHPRTPVTLQTIVLRPGPDGLFIESGRESTETTQRCDELAG